METILRYSFIYILMLAILDHGHGENAQGQISGEHCKTQPIVNDNSTFTNWTAEVKGNATIEASCYSGYKLSEVKGNATIEASCYSGYKLSGESTMTCLPNETWSAPPTCDILHCKTQPIVNDNSTFTNWTSEVKGNATIEASCYSGYKLSGESTMTCLPNETWSAPPTCDIL
ncbi:hypothetical protein DPMN_045694, partial [Dreissena polymorpha]